MSDDRIRIPRGTARVAWNPAALAAISADGHWHELKRCGRTTAYQTARQLNIALDLVSDPEFEFAAVDYDEDSSLLVRRIRAAA